MVALLLLPWNVGDICAARHGLGHRIRPDRDTKTDIADLARSAAKLGITFAVTFYVAANALRRMEKFYVKCIKCGFVKDGWSGDLFVQPA